MRSPRPCRSYSSRGVTNDQRSEEHTSELQSLRHLVCRLLFGKQSATTEIYALSLHDALPILEQDIERPLNAISEALPFVLIARGDERPVDEHGTSDDVLARHEAPVAGVEADVAIVAHGEEAARRHDQVAILHM